VKESELEVSNVYKEQASGVGLKEDDILDIWQDMAGDLEE